MALHNAFEALAVESKQDALNTLATSILAAANAIKAATEALDAKAVALNTNAVVVSNQVSQPLTNVQLRTDDLKVTLDNEQVAVSNLPATPSGALRVGNSKSKFRDQFLTFDTVNNWTVVSNPASQPITLGGNSGGARYLNIASGVDAGAETVILSKEKFQLPIKLVFGATMSQRIAGTDFFLELVEVDEAGNEVLDTSVFSAPTLRDSANAVSMMFSGTSTTNAYYAARSQGTSELVSGATSYGTTHMAPSGTSPNFFPTSQFEVLVKNDLFWIAARPINSTSAVVAAPASRTDICPDPDAWYAIRMRVRNTAIPASSTDCRVHFVRVLDAAALSVDFSLIGGSTIDSLAAPVRVINGSINAAVTIAPVTYINTAANFSAGATYTGASCDAGSPVAFRTFSATASSDQAGTFRIERSTDAATWRKATNDVAVTAGGSASLECPVTARYYRVIYVNGGVATTQFLITSAFHRV